MKRISRLIGLFLTTGEVQQLHSHGIQDPVTYSKNSSLQWNLAMEMIALVPWSGCERVLDIGCGDGKVTAFLAGKLPQGSILGIDISQKMIDFAKSHYAQDNLAFEREDGAEISFENRFDRIVSFSALHWILDQKKALKAFYDALVPGGKICLQTYGKFPMGVPIVADRLIHSEKWSYLFPSYTRQRVFSTEDEYRFLLKSAGFEQIQIKGSLSDIAFSNRQALLDFATPILNFICHLPDHLQKAFVEEVVDEIIAIAGISNDGHIHYLDFSIQVVAIKPSLPVALNT